jgi:membrane protein insertase Oxa1/YidC/SpoIIIJ
MPEGRRSISATLTLSNQFTMHSQSITKHGIIFCGNSSNSGKIFTLQKKILRIMCGAQPRTSCQSLLKQLEILSASWHFILSLMNFIINSKENFQTNSSVYNINTWNKHHLHKPNNNLSCSQKRTFYAGTKSFKSLSPSVTILKKEQVKFRRVLRKYLNIPPFILWLIFCVKIIHITLLCKMLFVFCTVKIVYNCVFMTCVKFMDPWNVYMCVCVCLCVCVCVYIHWDI